ncbi:MAG: TetR/AcrR family transcriptional regulator [Bacteroidetes bacterium]|nr:TetR/AcrR family transcriptional regulator [Bacteroidota bacterium]
MGKYEKQMTLTTEEKILSAAKEIFTKRGFVAARMQEIADAAEINKGLLHYYFKSKDKLFQAVFEEAFLEFVVEINKLFEANIPFFEKLEAIVESYLDMLLKNPALPSFIINEINRDPEKFIENTFKNMDLPNPLSFLGQIQLEIQAGNIRPVNPFHLLINIVSLCVFPFIARPLIQNLVQIDRETYMKFMEDRKKEVVDFLIHALKEEPSKELS